MATLAIALVTFVLGVGIGGYYATRSYEALLRSAVREQRAPVLKVASREEWEQILQKVDERMGRGGKGG